MKASRLLMTTGIVFVSGLLAAQTSAPAPSPSDIASEIQALRDAVKAQQQQIAEQQKQIEALKSQVANTSTPHLANATLKPVAQPALAVSSDVPMQEQPKSPLSFKIGDADFTPGGFLDFTSFFRTTNVGSGIGTSFGAIPFSSIVQGQMSEFRMTAQDSRLSLKVTDKFGRNDVTGYVEADFLGTQPANAFVTSNSQTNRLRLYWVDLKRDKWEFLGGQSWSWLTPNRVGVSAAPADIFYGLGMDTNYLAGLTWTRAAQFRVVYHPSDHWAWGVALENPQQYNAGEVTFPFAFSAILGSQFDNGSNTATPNLMPDIIPKVSYDTDMNGGRHFHAEAAGLLTTAKISLVGPTGFISHTKAGAGISAGVNAELVKNFRLVASGFYSEGGGRYIFGLGPQAVVVPNATGTDADLSFVHSGSGVLGVEAQVNPSTLLAAYYSGAYFQRNAFPDPTNPIAGRLAGFGGSNTLAANRAIQEATIDWTQTFWKKPQYGSVQLINQASYLTRAPWFVALGAPKNAHVVMVYSNLRYTLP